METASHVGLGVGQPNQAANQIGNSHIKTTFLVMGIILMVGGAVSTGVLHSRLGHLSLYCLGTFPVGVLLLVLSLRNVQKSDVKVQTKVQASKAPVFERLSDEEMHKITFLKPPDIVADIYKVNTIDEKAIVIGLVPSGQKFGITDGSKIILFSKPEEDDFEDTWSYDCHRFDYTDISLELNRTEKGYTLTITQNKDDPEHRNTLRFNINDSNPLTDEFGQKYMRAELIEEAN